MSDHLRRIYDLERQLPERNFAKEHSYEEWLEREGERAIVNEVLALLESSNKYSKLQIATQIAAYVYQRDKVAPDVSQLARTVAEKVEAGSYLDGERDSKPAVIAIIESVLAGSNQKSGDEATDKVT